MSRAATAWHRLCRRPAIWLGAGALLGLSGCLDLALISSIAFPPTVPGLDPQQSWVSLPVSSWVTEGSVEAAAIAGCFDCASPAAVGLFRASGPAGAELLREASRPEAVAALLLRKQAGKIEAKRAPPAVATAVEPVSEGGWTGFAVRLARSDGSKSATGVALARRGRSGVTVLLVVAGTDQVARRIAREVVAKQT